MEYSEILKQVEEQKEKKLSGKIFRYSGLILAVDYFSQKQLGPDHDAAFDFVNELLRWTVLPCTASGTAATIWSGKRAGASG